MDYKRKIIQFVERGKAELREADFKVDTLGRDTVLLKTIYTLISPGTEFDCLNGNNNRGPIVYPIALGYSAVATVLDVGSEVTHVKKGDRCLCYHSCHSNYQLLPAHKVVKIESDELPSEEALFCVIGCMGFQGVRRCRPEFGESLMVMGLGLLGQFAVQTARLSGCYPVIALDFEEKRRNLALESGADAAFSPDDPQLKEKILALTDGRGVDCTVEVTGNPQAVIQGLDLTAYYGRCTLVGCSRTPTEKIDFYNLVHLKGISVIGANNTARPLHDKRPGLWTMSEDMRLLLRYMAAGRLDSKRLLTMIAQPEEGPGIYDRLFARDRELLGVVFDWTKY